jgi:probable rRNA maturation factor
VSAAIAKPMKINIINAHKLSKEQLISLKKKIKLILHHLNVPRETEICISFIDDTGMRELNKTYRRMDKTTDVLSFPQDVTNLTLDLNAAIAFENKNQTLILGDIVISVDTAKKHSAIHRKSIEEEIDKLIIHGILHLLGYDHKKKSDANLMREKENELLSLVESI